MKNGIVSKRAIVRHTPTNTYWLVDAKIDLDKLGMSGPMRRAIKRAVEGDGTATCLGGSVKVKVNAGKEPTT